MRPDGGLADVIRFQSLDDPTDPAAAARAYEAAGAVQLYLDGREVPREVLQQQIGRISATASISLSVAAELTSVEAVKTVLEAGALRVAIGAPALRDPNFITGLARAHGSEAVAVWVDCARADNGWRVAATAASQTEWDAVTWSRVVEAQGGGQVIIREVASEGAFDLELVKAVTSAVTVPVLTVSKSPTLEDVFDALMIGDADGVLLDSLLHSGEQTIDSVHTYLTEHGVS